MPHDKVYFLIFATIHDVLKAERILKDAALDVEVVPVPRTLARIAASASNPGRSRIRSPVFWAVWQASGASFLTGQNTDRVGLFGPIYRGAPDPRAPPAAGPHRARSVFVEGSRRAVHFRPVSGESPIPDHTDGHVASHDAVQDNAHAIFLRALTGHCTESAAYHYPFVHGQCNLSNHRDTP